MSLNISNIFSFCKYLYMKYETIYISIMEMLYGYLIKHYKENEPIFLAELQIEGMSSSNLRQQLKKLADSGTLKISGKQGAVSIIIVM